MEKRRKERKNRREMQGKNAKKDYKRETLEGKR